MIIRNKKKSECKGQKKETPGEKKRYLNHFFRENIR